MATNPRGVITRFIFLGAPGVGKGTFATRIAPQLSVPHIAAGDIIRDHIRQGTPLGLECKRFTDKGDLVPDSLVTELMLETVKHQDTGEVLPGFILDGFPRNVAQAKALQKEVWVDRVMNIQMEEHIAIEKVLGRRNCAECGESFNIAELIDGDYDMPALLPTPERCPRGIGGPECEARLEKRDDDTAQVVKHRMDVFKQSTRPLEMFYANIGVLRSFTVKKGIADTERLMDDMLNDHSLPSQVV